MKNNRRLQWILGTFVVCVLLMVAAYAMPTTRIREHVSPSGYCFEKGGLFELAYGYMGMRVDTFTEMLMLDIASYDGDEGLLERTFASKLYGWDNMESNPDLEDVFSTLYHIWDKDVRVESYSRYWHGYVPFLRLALTFMYYPDIKVLNSMLLVGLTFGLLYVISGVNRKCMIPFAVSILFMSPIPLYYCLSYAPVMYVALIGSMILVKWQLWKNRKALTTFFIIEGMLTSYFDFLSFPLVALGIPLILTVCLNEEENYKGRNRYIGAIRFVLELSISWALGYGCMWASKWVLATIFTDENTILIALGTALYRASPENDDGVHISLFEPMKELLKMLWRKPYVIVGILLAAGIAIRNIYCHREQGKTGWNLCRLCQLLFIALYPVVWSVVMRNHSYIHYYFVYRILSISIFAVCAVLLGCCEEEKDYERRIDGFDQGSSIG